MSGVSIADTMHFSLFLSPPEKLLIITHVGDQKEKKKEKKEVIFSFTACLFVFSLFLNLSLLYTSSFY